MAQLNSTTINGDLSATGTISALDGGLSISDPNNIGLELGRKDGTAGTPYIDFHTDGDSATDYNSRILASGSNLNITADGGLYVNGTQVSLSDHIHSRLTNTAGDTGQVLLVYDSGYYYLRPSNTVTLCGSSGYPWYRTYTDRLNVNSTASITGMTTVQARIQPNADNSVNLGYTSYKWMNVYCNKSTLTTSDLNQKRDLKEIDDRYIQLFDLIQPYAYYYTNGDRVHTGFIAQYVEEAMKQVGLTADELGFFCKDIKKEVVYDENGDYVEDRDVYDEDGNLVYEYGLRYEEYIAIMTLKMKCMEQKINELEFQLEKVNDLEARLAVLENV